MNTKESRNEPQSTGPNTAPPNGDMPRPFNNQTTVRRLSDAGFHLLPEVVVPGWIPLKPVRPFFGFIFTASINNIITDEAESQPCQTTNRRNCYAQGCRAG